MREKRLIKGTEKYPFNTDKILGASHVVLFCAKTSIEDSLLLDVLDKEERDERYPDSNFKEQMHAGVFKTSRPRTKEGYDVRYVVNTFAPYILTKALLEKLKEGRVVNLSSSAQASVDLDAMIGKVEMSDFEAYAQSKLAITMWSRHMASQLKNNGPVIIAVNPASLLGTKMVKEGFNTSGNDINIGVNILTSLSLDDEHLNHSGEYYDNDNQRYAPPQADGLDDAKAKKIVAILDRF